MYKFALGLDVSSVLIITTNKITVIMGIYMVTYGLIPLVTLSVSFLVKFVYEWYKDYGKVSKNEKNKYGYIYLCLVQCRPLAYLIMISVTSILCTVFHPLFFILVSSSDLLIDLPICWFYIKCKVHTCYGGSCSVGKKLIEVIAMLLPHILLPLMFVPATFLSVFVAKYTVLCTLTIWLIYLLVKFTLATDNLRKNNLRVDLYSDINTDIISNVLSKNKILIFFNNKVRYSRFFGNYLGIKEDSWAVVNEYFSKILYEIMEVEGSEPLEIIEQEDKPPEDKPPEDKPSVLVQWVDMSNDMFTEEKIFLDNNNTVKGFIDHLNGENLLRFHVKTLSLDNMELRCNATISMNTTLLAY